MLLALLGGAPAFYECPPVNVWIVADNSGSISREELNQAVTVVLGALDDWGESMEQNTLWVGCSVFSDSTQRIADFAGVPAQIEDSLPLIQSAAGGTDIIFALRTAMDEFDKDFPRFYQGINIIILLSDGIDSYSVPDAATIESYRGEWEQMPPVYRFWVMDISTRPSLFLDAPYQDGGGYSRAHNYLALRAYSSDAAVYDAWSAESVGEMIEQLKEVVDCNR